MTAGNNTSMDEAEYKTNTRSEERRVGKECLE